MQDWVIRPEQPEDIPAIEQIVTAAFGNYPSSSYLKHDLIVRLRAMEKLTGAFVALRQGQIIGHITFSPIRFSGRNAISHWYSLTTLAVHPDHQRQGIGSALVRNGIIYMRKLPKPPRGLVVAGLPQFFQHFGFQVMPDLFLANFPKDQFLALPLQFPLPSGQVKYYGFSFAKGKLTEKFAFA